MTKAFDLDEELAKNKKNIERVAKRDNHIFINVVKHRENCDTMAKHYDISASRVREIVMREARRRDRERFDELAREHIASKFLFADGYYDKLSDTNKRKNGPPLAILRENPTFWEDKVSVAEPKGTPEPQMSFEERKAVVGEATSEEGGKGLEDKFIETATGIARLVYAKNRAYGDSFSKTGDILRILYPNGVRPGQYNDMLAITRILDKIFRIATDKDAFGEDPFSDVLGYSLVSVVKRSRRGDEG